MRKFQAFSLAATMLALPSFAKTIDLRSQEGIGISVHYEVDYRNTSGNKPGYLWKANPLVITVHGDGIRRTDRIHAVLLNKVQTEAVCGRRSSVEVYEYQVDLQSHGEGRFSGEVISSGVILWGIGEHRQYIPASQIGFTLDLKPYCGSEVSIGTELAIVVNGHWLKDPINGSHNFQIHLTK